MKKRKNRKVIKLHPQNQKKHSNRILTPDELIFKASVDADKVIFGGNTIIGGFKDDDMGLKVFDMIDLKTDKILVTIHLVSDNGYAFELHHNNAALSGYVRSNIFDKITNEFKDLVNSLEELLFEDEVLNVHKAKEVIKTDFSIFATKPNLGLYSLQKSLINDLMFVAGAVTNIRYSGTLK